MKMNERYKKVISISKSVDKIPHHFGSAVKYNTITTYNYKLECGHTVTRIARDAGSGAMSRTMVRCEWCESGEEYTGS
jgi:hypothetical protein